MSRALFLFKDKDDGDVFSRMTTITMTRMIMKMTKMIIVIINNK